MNDIIRRLRDLEDDPECKMAMFRVDDIRALVATIEMLTEKPEERLTPLLTFSIHNGTLRINGRELGIVDTQRNIWAESLITVFDQSTLPVRIVKYTDGFNSAVQMEYSNYGRVSVVDGGTES